MFFHGEKKNYEEVKKIKTVLSLNISSEEKWLEKVVWQFQTGPLSKILKI